MMYNKRRRLPVGIQSFKNIREDKYLYVDKTDLVWQLATEGPKYVFLSRPRRFGKSVLVDTLRCYFEGRKELFEGLRIMQLEQEWTEYPVIRLDMSRGGASEATIRSYLNIRFGEYEEMYGITPVPTAQLADRFHAIIYHAYRHTGRKVVVLIDEYDSPLMHSWKTPEHEACTATYREVFAILKADDEYERFVFITGVTKLTQISLFSALNNLANISFYPEYAAICGITEEEITENFSPEMESMARENGWTLTEAHDRLKEYYDGYHFSRRNMLDVYNPFSLVNALASCEVGNYWVSSGATSLLPKFVGDMEIHLQDLENCSVMRDTLESSDVSNGGPETFLYQSGYLTIKGSDDFGYRLGFPNTEVRRALSNCVLPALTMRALQDVQSMQANFFRQMGTGHLDEAMRLLKSLVADVPYSNKKMASMDMEERYRLIISTVLNSVGFQVEVEHMLATGRIDVLARTSRYIYLLELKLENAGGSQAAVRQIAEKHYLEPFRADGREVIGVGIGLDSEGKGLVDWRSVQEP